jgi:hypothetical protein
MHRFVVLITGVHVLVHGIFGCGDHIILGRQTHCSTVLHDCHAVNDGIEGRHHEEEHSPTIVVCSNCEPTDLSIEASHAKQDHDCHASCHWLTTNASGLELLLQLVPACDAILSRPMDGASTSEVAGVRDHGKNGALPLRSHLAFGVLQI